MGKRAKTVHYTCLCSGEKTKGLEPHPRTAYITTLRDSHGPPAKLLSEGCNWSHVGPSISQQSVLCLLEDRRASQKCGCDAGRSRGPPLWFTALLLRVPKALGCYDSLLPEAFRNASAQGTGTLHEKGGWGREIEISRGGALHHS